MDHAIGVLCKKSSPNQRPFRFSSVLSSRSFIVLCFTFRSLIHFELIFVKDVRFVSRSGFLHVDVQLLKILSFLHCIAFAPLSKIR